MNIIAFLLLFSPGILVWKITEDRKPGKPISVSRTLLTILLDDLLILVAAYFLLYQIYGRIEVSFSSQYIERIVTSLYSVSFVWKYGAVSCLCAAGLAMAKLLLSKWSRKREAAQIR